jgi:hypothetical protein
MRFKAKDPVASEKTLTTKQQGSQGSADSRTGR